MGHVSKPKTIDIRPDVGVYATYRRLSYRPWYAIAEFVDNSTQNYYDHKKELFEIYEKEDGSKVLRIEITYDNEKNTLTIVDNANGMNLEELERAVVLNRPPPNQTGRCEYGMGLKTAACWFGPVWTIETSRLGGDKKYFVKVDVPYLSDNHIDKIDVLESPSTPSTHYTRITIYNLYKPIRGSTPNRIKEQLSSMYREDLRSREVEIVWNYQQIDFAEPTFLEEDMEDHVNIWKKDISFIVPWEDEGKTLGVHGWVGIRMPGKQRDAGFVLIRRGRVIVGGPSEGYKPSQIFGQGNTFRSQRLIGELHLNEWPVTQAKDGFDWYGGLEDALIEALRHECSEYMEKAEVYREQRTIPITNGDVKLISERTQKMFSNPELGKALVEEIRFPEPVKTDKQIIEDTSILKKASFEPIEIDLDVGSEVWNFRLYWVERISDAPWINIENPQDNRMDIYLNMTHPFFAAYLEEPDFLELIMQFVVALALSEKMARLSSTNGMVDPGTIRINMNRILRRVADIEVK